jgi:hypothetical protein
MENQALLILLESILGKGHQTSKGNVAFHCPFCNHIKHKLEIQLDTNENKENPWHCWTCPPENKSKGKFIKTLLGKLESPSNKFQELKLIIKPGSHKINIENQIKLPDEFISLFDTNLLDKSARLAARHAIKYIKKRGLTEIDILKYNVGFCAEGKYHNRIIIPSYDDKGNLNYFIARDYSDILSRKYDNPPVIVKDIIGMELYINWDAPIILVEGMFDFLTIKRNCIPLFGKVIHDTLMKKLVSSSVQKIYIALDKDAIKDAIKHCEKLMSFGKEVYLVELEGKDANSIGFEKFLEVIENTSPLTFYTLMEKKINKTCQ